MIDNKFLSSPEDSRDFIFEDIFTDNINIPYEYDPRKNLLPIRDQKSEGSCVAESLSAIKEIQETKQVGFSEYMSPQFVFNLRINQDSQGMYPRNAMQILRNIGIVPEEDYPYGWIQKPEDIKDSYLFSAANYKIKSYAKVLTEQGTKKAVIINGSVMICVPVYSIKDPIWKEVKVNDTPIAGHAMAIVGWSKGGFIIRNSWNETFGSDKNGYCFMPYSEFDQVKDKCEIWAIYDEDSKPDPQFSKWYFKWLRGLKNITLNLGSFFYLAAIGELLTLGIGFKEHNCWYLSAIIVLGIAVFAYLKKYYLLRDKN